MARPGLSAHWSVPSLLTSLANAGWGPLAGRAHQGLRTTLHALTAALPHRSGEGKATAWQIHRRAGLSERWVRYCLHVLEDLGLIEWTPGGVIDGVCQPSHFRIVKAALVDLIRAARATVEGAYRAHREAVERRLAALRSTKWLPSPARNATPAAAPAHAELDSRLPAPRGEEPSGGSAPAFDLNLEKDGATRRALSRQALEAPAPTAPIGGQRVTTLRETPTGQMHAIKMFLPAFCAHGAETAWDCDTCASDAEAEMWSQATAMGRRLTAQQLGEHVARAVFGAVA